MAQYSHSQQYQQNYGNPQNKYSNSQQPQYNYQGRDPNAFENKDYDNFQVNFSQSNGSFYSLDGPEGFQGQQHQKSAQQQQDQNWGFQEPNYDIKQNQNPIQNTYNNNNNSQNEFRESQYQYQHKTVNSQQQLQQQQQYQPQQYQQQDISQMPEKAIPLISVGQDDKFVVNQEAKEILEMYEGNVAFVAVAGKYRTGKSYLLNKLLGIQGRGFKVDEGTASCTQGIWMWSKPLRNKDGLNIFFIDTEGSSSVEKTQKHDAKVFALAILMSSYFVFNSVGCIDENAMSQLSLTTSISKNIAVSQYGGKKDKDVLSQYAPKFLWILRDFVLQIQNEFNKDITPNEYMENALLNDTQSQKTKKVRQSLCEFFKHRECVTMIRPIEDESALQRLDSIPDNQIRQQFIQKLSYIRQVLTQTIDAKRINGQPLNSRMFTAMVDSFVERINEKHGIPSIATAWEAIVEKECQQAKEEAQEMYLEKVQEKIQQNVDKNLSYWELFQLLRETRDTAISQFENVAGIKEKNDGFKRYLEDLKQFITEKETEIIKINDNLASTTCGSLLDKVFFELKININNRKDIYNIKNIQDFHQDFNYALSSYNKQFQGPQKAESLIQFLRHVERPMVKAIVNTIEFEKESKFQNVSATDTYKQEKLQDLKAQLNLKQTVFERKKDNFKRWDKKIKDEKASLNDISRQLQKQNQNKRNQMSKEQFQQAKNQLKSQIQKLDYTKNQANGDLKEKQSKGFRLNQQKYQQQLQQSQQQQAGGGNGRF